MTADDNRIDWDVLGFVVASDYRRAVVDALDDAGPATPTTLGERTNLAITHVSRTLTELRERDVVELLVPEDRKKGRIYGLTEDGQQLVGEIDEVGE
ncbi:helix-turn-helix domain-containing protein [Halobacterium sp. KA-6]|uniref:helix-turn-helix domain-containing protein n=1 Tax=Halobacterium sp. KA-6 TaxID=2896368 RepID=UPI001E548C5E|nr:ArsR family transcriptional regulator [Halobacterium sp. KA-6]MCD2204524.1 ArsR family transcriptional regulator [Halobacterium sp. KA-6]